jgi:uncharacterized DUF497 family protein
MRFTWDPAKDKANRLKHAISFDVAKCVFEDANQLSVQDRHQNGEERWQTLGLVGPHAVILVAHTYEDEDGQEVVRIISARKATKPERQRYDERSPKKRTGCA